MKDNSMRGFVGLGALNIHPFFEEKWLQLFISKKYIKPSYS